MDVLNNPSLEAEEWRVACTCSNCGAQMKNISIDNVFYEHSKHYYKCGFCMSFQSVTVPQAVKFEISKRPITEPPKPKAKKPWRYWATTAFTAILMVLVFNCLASIKSGNKDVAVLTLFLSNTLAIGCGVMLFVEDQE